MILEFVGLPGSGKTTLANLLLAELRRQHRLIFERRELENAISVHRYIFYAKCWEEGGIWCLKRGKIFHPFRPVKFAPLYWLIKDQLLSQYFLKNYGHDKEAFYFPEEGLLQHTANLRVHWNQKVFEDSSWLSAVPPEQVTVIHTQIEPALGFERVWQRGLPTSWPVAFKERSRAEAVYRLFHETLTATIGEFRQRGGNVSTVSTAGDAKFLKGLSRDLAAEVLTRRVATSPGALG